MFNIRAWNKIRIKSVYPSLLLMCLAAGCGKSPGGNSAPVAPGLVSAAGQLKPGLVLYQANGKQYGTVVELDANHALPDGTRGAAYVAASESRKDFPMGPGEYEWVPLKTLETCYVQSGASPSGTPPK